MNSKPETIRDVIRLGAIDLRVVCDDCGHAGTKSVYSRALDNDDLRIDDLRKRLRCERCGSREPSVAPRYPEKPYGGYPTTWGTSGGPALILSRDEEKR